MGKLEIERERERERERNRDKCSDSNFVSISIKLINLQWLYLTFAICMFVDRKSKNFVIKSYFIL